MSEVFQFANPWYLCLLVLPCLLLILQSKTGGAQFGAFAILEQVYQPSRGPFIYKLLMAIGLSSLIIAIARPQYGSQIVEYSSNGRDLMLVIDLSRSMRLDDMQNDNNERITRLETVFTAAEEFINGRKNDRIGLVFFSERALTSCPLTRDHNTLLDILKRTRVTQEALWEQNSNLLGNGTLIGNGLGSAIKALDKRDDKESEKQLGRAIVLITDGQDSKGHRDPLMAAKHAHHAGIHVHSIGVGNPQGTFTNTDFFGRKQVQRIGRNELPDMNLLKKIARDTEGVAMRAGNKDELQEVFSKIDELEPSPRDERRRDNYSDHFFWPLICGILLCACALLCEPRLRGALA